MCWCVRMIMHISCALFYVLCGVVSYDYVLSVVAILPFLVCIVVSVLWLYVSFSAHDCHMFLCFVLGCRVCSPKVSGISLCVGAVGCICLCQLSCLVFLVCVPCCYHVVCCDCSAFYVFDALASDICILLLLCCRVVPLFVCRCQAPPCLTLFMLTTCMVYILVFTVIRRSMLLCLWLCLSYIRCYCCMFLGYVCSACFECFLLFFFVWCCYLF